MVRAPRPLVLLASLASFWIFLRDAQRAAEVELLPSPALWTIVLVEAVLALGIVELGRRLPPWRLGWLAGTLLLVTLTIVVYVRTNTEAMNLLLQTGAGADAPYPPMQHVIWVGRITWFLAFVSIGSWLWALRRRVAAAAWALAAGLLLLHLLDAVFELLPWRGSYPEEWPRAAAWFERAMSALPAVGFLLLAIVLVCEELRLAKRPEGTPWAVQARAGALLCGAFGASVLVGCRDALAFPVVPISLAVASGGWIAYAAAGSRPGLARGVFRFVAGAVLFLILSEAAQRGAERYMGQWFMRMLKGYPDAMTVLLFFTASFVTVLLVGVVMRIVRCPRRRSARRPWQAESTAAESWNGDSR